MIIRLSDQKCDVTRNAGTKGAGTADLRTLAETFAKAMNRYADARRRFAADSLADVIVTLKGERDDAGSLLRRTMLEQKVARLEAEVAELKDAAEEDAESLNALEKALQRVVVRECGDAIRDALTDAALNYVQHNKRGIRPTKCVSVGAAKMRNWVGASFEEETEGTDGAKGTRATDGTNGAGRTRGKRQKQGVKAKWKSGDVLSFKLDVREMGTGKF